MKTSELLTLHKVQSKLVDYPRDKVEDFVEKMFKFYSRSAAYQATQDVRFELTFDDYLELFEPRLLNSMARSFAKGTIEARQSSEHAFVLSWKSRQHKLAGVMNAESALICPRKVSIHNCRYLPGEERDEKARKKMSDKKKGKKRPEAVKQKIAETKTGQTYDDAHRKAISDALKGKPKSAASNERRAEAAKAYWAAKRAAQEVRA